MASVIQLHRSTGSAGPSGLAPGEQAYVDGLDMLFIRDAGNANDVVVGGPMPLKKPVRAASTANVDESSAPASIDGVTLSSGDRVLLKDQSAGAENGIWVFNGAASAMTRALDWNNSSNAQSGFAVFVQEGTANADKGFMCDTNGTITVGTTAITFIEFTGSGSFTGGDGIDITGGVISVDLGTDPGLEFVTGTLEAKVDANSSLAKAAAGLQVVLDPAGGLEHNGATGIRLEAAVAGNGLTHTSGVLDVDALNTLPAPAGDLSMASNKITNLTDPTAAQDAATKAYVDSVANGLDVKASCRVATTANITLSGEQTIDGVLTSADRILVKNQSTASENGIYVTAAGAWSRAADADANAEVTAGLFTFIEEGSTQADTGWVLTTNDPITVGSTSLSFSQFTGVADLVGGNGLTKTGNTLDVNVDDSTIEINADILRVKANGINGTHIAMGSDATGDIMKYNGTDYARLARGSAGQMLKVNAGGTDLEYSDTIDGGTF